MTENRIRLTRQELYDRVWSTPISRIAKEFRLSDVGMSKICKRHQIPRPGLGYWARIAHGQKPNREPLPPAKPGDSEIIEITVDLSKSEGSNADKFEDTKAELERIRNLPQPVVDMSSRHLKHPMIQALQKIRREKKPSQEGELSEANRNLPNLTVAAGSWDRAIRILDAIFTYAEKIGYVIAVEEEEGTFIRVLGENIQIRLRETLKRKPRVPASGTLASYEPKFDYVPSGILCFSITNLFSKAGAQTEWSDTQISRLEDRLAEIFEGLVEAAARFRVWHLDLAQMHSRYQEDERLRIEREERSRREKTQLEKLLIEANSWHKAGLIRAYVQARREAEIRKNGEITPASDSARWFEEALAIADRIDPLLNRASQGEDEKDSSD